MENEKTFWYVEQFDETGQAVGGVLFEDADYLQFISEEKKDYPNFSFRVTTLQSVEVKVY